MSQLDIVIFGATGFTGKRAVEEMARGGSKYAGVTWGIAGRSQKKLEALLEDMTAKTGADLSGVRVIVADVSDEASLRAMCEQARVLANCCGPYRLYGEQVLRACLDAGAHYVDVSGEPQFIESMALKYGSRARAAGVYAVSACGLDSVPNDMGVVFLQQNFHGTLNSVESYLSSEIAPQYKREALINGCVNYGTWESLVYSLAHYDELKPLRKKLFPEPMPAFKPKLEKRFPVHKQSGSWCVPFLGADNSIVYRTQRHLYETGDKRPAQFRAYLQFPNLFYVMLLTFFGGLVMLMSKTRFTRQLLLDYPRIFSCGLITRQGPKREVMDNSRFTVRLVGRGWAAGTDVGTTPPNKTVVAKVSGSDPGYGFTALALMQCALTLLREQPALPPGGGVLTTGAAFKDTNLIKNLQNNHVTFEIVESK